METTTKALIDGFYEKWKGAAAGVTPVTLPAPLAIIIGESVEVGMLYTAYWPPTRRDDGQLLPSFSEVAEKSALHETLGDEIYELQAATGKVQADYVKATELQQGSPMDRAQLVLQEIKLTLEFVLDDDEYTLADEQLTKVNATYPNPTSQDVMSLALEAYAALASEHRDAITGVGGFSPALIDEAYALVGALRARSGEALIADKESGAARLLEQRNALATLLLDRLNRVRRASRYVFRAHPSIARKFTSSYDRARRRGHSRRKQETPQVAAPSATAE